MEIRKVQLTGGSSFVLSLPKNWIKRQNIQKNDPIGVITQADGTLLLTPNLTYDSAVRIKEFALKDYPDPDVLLRALIGAYITGYTLIKITSAGRIPPKARGVIRNFTRLTIGQEVAEETDNSIILKDILNTSEMPFENTIRRMYIIVKAMHEDALSALEENRFELAEDVMARDTDVDRLHWLIHRQSLLVVMNPSLARKMELSPAQAAMYYQTSRVLEQVGDYAVIIADSVNALLKSKVDHTIVAKIRRLGDVSSELFNRSIKTIYSGDIVEANEVITDYETLKDEFRSFGNSIPKMPPQDIIALTTIASSTFRVTEYSSEIAKIVINNSVGKFSASDNYLN